MAGDADRAEIIAQIAAARAEIARTGRSLEQSADALKRKLDLPSRAKASYTKHKGAWLGCAALAGFLLSKLPARKKTVFVERSTGQALGAAGKLGMLWGALKFATGLAKPFVADMVAQRMQDMAQRMAAQGSPADEENSSQRHTNS